MKQLLIPFAREQGSDDLACFEFEGGKVAGSGIHYNLGKPVYVEFSKEYPNVWAWLCSAVKDSKDLVFELNLAQTNSATRWIIDNDSAVRHPCDMSKPALGRGLGALLRLSAIAKPAPVTPSPVITESTNTTHISVPATTPHTRSSPRPRRCRAILCAECRWVR